MGFDFFSSVKAMGSPNKGTSFGQVRRLIFTTDEQQFATKVLMAAATNWNTAVAAQTMFVPPPVVEVEDKSTEGVIYSAASGRMIAQVVPPIRGNRYFMMMTCDQFEAMKSLNGQKLRVYMIDDLNNVKCTSPDGIICQGAKVGYLNVLPLTQPTNEKPELCVIDIQEENIDELDIKRIQMNPSFSFSEVVALTEVTLSCSIIAANALTATVAWISRSESKNTGVFETVPIGGVLAANVLMINQTAATQTVTVTTITKTATGWTYTFAGTAITGGTCQIIPSATFPFISNIVTIASA